jgi:hypothetical protein
MDDQNKQTKLGMCPPGEDSTSTSFSLQDDRASQPVLLADEASTSDWQCKVISNAFRMQKRVESSEYVRYHERPLQLGTRDIDDVRLWC